MALLTSVLVGAIVAAVAGAVAFRFLDLPKEHKARDAILIGLGIGAIVFFVVWSVEGQGTWQKLHGTVRGVAIAVGVSALIFIGANKLFDLAPKRWQIYTTSVYGGVTLFVFLLLSGNRVIENPVLWTVVATVIGAATGWLVAVTEERATRVGITTAAGAVLGLITGFTMAESVTLVKPREGEFVIGLLPKLDIVGLAIWTLAGVAAGALIWVLRGRKHDLVKPLLGFGAFGWLLGAFAASELGAGTQLQAIVGAGVFGALLGARLGWPPRPTIRQREELERRSKVWVFLAPAMVFITLALVIPTLRTIYLSFLDGRGQEFVGGDNYVDIFTDKGIFDVSKWTAIFSSALTWWGLGLIAVGIIAGRIIGRQTGRSFEVTGGSGPPIAFGIFLLAFGVFSVLRGTIFNNLWWVFTVVILATSLGLGIAVLADRAKYESVAKSIIFLPMAVSFVGATIIWRFMYIARPPQDEQTGVLNALWVGLGSLSHSTTPKYIAVAVLLLIVAGLGFLAYRGWKAEANGVLGGALVTAAPLLWIVYRLLGPGLGGFVENTRGEIVADTILFVQQSPMNNVWLMVVLIWMQAGFSMVIFSAAIKGVPSDMIEAAKVDGATESQTFWRVIIPQIATTIGVVVTTLIVLVMKVFDIVKVMTNGNFGTQVLANEMWQKAFTEFNFGAGSAVAVVLFVSVLPVMYINIRRMQRA